MTKVKTRNWSIEKFSGSVKRTTSKIEGATFDKAICQKGYDDGWTVRQTAEKMPVKKVAAKTTAKKPEAAKTKKAA